MNVRACYSTFTWLKCFHAFLLLVHSDTRDNWVAALQDCTKGRHLPGTMSSSPPLTPDYQGYLVLKGIRHKLYKLYTVVASDRVFLYKNLEVRSHLCVYRDQFGK